MKKIAFLTGLCLFSSWAYCQKPDSTYKRFSLGTNINTPEYHESGPVISPDGKTLFFWSMDRPDSKGLQDIYFSNFDEEFKEWTNGIHLNYPLNDPACNIPLSITPDGSSLLIYRKSDKKNEADLALSKKGVSGWEAPKALKIENYNNLGQSSVSGYLGADGKTLILSMYSDKTEGKEDLYVSFFNKEKKTWSEPKNLGKTINTAFAESTPFLAADGLTLYFSTPGMGGLGGDDIFMSQRLDNTWQNWTKPKNLGSIINTNGDDFYFKFPAAADFAYMVSTDSATGLKDIYSIKLPESIKPKPVALVSGKAIDQKTQKPVLAHITYQNIETGEEIGSAQADADSGMYSIILPTGNFYGFMAEADGYFAISENLDLKQLSSYKEISKDLILAPIELGMVIRLNNLFFDTGAQVLKKESYPELNRFLKLLNAQPNMKIEISGHTDNVGDKASNLKLSLARAQSVKNYLVSKAIDPNRIVVKGYGSDKPLENNATEAGKKKNRRVEFIIQSL